MSLAAHGIQAMAASVLGCTGFVAGGIVVVCGWLDGLRKQTQGSELEGFMVPADVLYYPLMYQSDDDLQALRLDIE